MISLTNGLAAAFAAFCVVALRAFQQQNVVHGYFKWAVVTSYALAFADIAIVLAVVASGWPVAIYIGTGGAFGVTFAMFVHTKFIRKRAAQTS